MNSQFSKNALTQSQNKPTPFNKAYFASKSELLNWASKLLDLELTSLEQLETGAIFCQLLDACHPGSVRLNKLNWKANNETDYISNFKIFQQGLTTNNINKPIDINRLIKGKQYDLNELLQWIYGYYLNSRDNVREVYNAKRKRGGQNFVYKNNKKNELKKKYRKKGFIRNNSKDRDNMTLISTASGNISSNNSINGDNNYNYRNNNFNVSILRQNLRNHNYNQNYQFNNNNNYYNNYRNNSEPPYDDIKYRNKSKQESRNKKYQEFEEKILNHTNNISNNIYTQNKTNIKTINNINNPNYNSQYSNTAINQRYPSNSNMNINPDINYNQNNNNNINSNSNRNFKNIFEKTPAEYQPYISNQINNNQLYQETENIKYNYELDDMNNELENENELNMTDFCGLNEEEMNKLIKEEKNDGYKVRDLKNIIRKLRINLISMDKDLLNFKNAISMEYKLKNFYLNKLKDIEYLYFNPVIKNSNENKNTILRQILCSNQDTTIILNESNYAYLRNGNNNDNNLNGNKSLMLSKNKNKKQNNNNINNDNVVENKINNDINEKRFEINIDNSININNNNIKPNDEKSIKLNCSSRKNFDANYIDNLFDSFNDNSKMDFYENINNLNNEEKKKRIIPIKFSQNDLNLSQFTNHPNNNNINKINNNENINMNYQQDSGKINYINNEKKYLAYSEKKKDNLNNLEKSNINNKTEFKNNNNYIDICSQLLNDSLHISHF